MTATNKENFNYLQGHVPILEVEGEEGSTVLMRVVKTTQTRKKVKRTVLAAIQTSD